MNEIINTGDVALEAYEASGRMDEPGELGSDLVATHEPERKGIEFHVSMRGHTFEDMEELIVHAAAEKLIKRLDGGRFQKLVEERCIALITGKIDKHLAGITAEIIDQPVTPKFGDKKPVTMREMIGLTGREYLTERVDMAGNPSTDAYRTEPRINRLVAQHMATVFKREIEAATNSAINEVQKAAKEHHASFLAQEKARLREAIAKVTA